MQAIDSFRQWLQVHLGLGPVVQDLVLAPLFVVAFIWALRRLVLTVASLRDRHRHSSGRWRTVSAYIAFALGVALTSGIWLTSVRHFADLFDARTPAEMGRLQVLLEGVLYTVFATFVLAVLIRFLRGLRQMAVDRMERWSQADGAIRFRDFNLISRVRVRDSILLAVRVLRGFFILLLLYIYIPLVLSFFPITAPYGDRLLQYVVEPAAEILKEIIDYLPNLIYLVLIVVAARYTLKLLKFLLDAVGRGELVLGRFEQDWADPTYKLLRVVAVAFTLMIVYPYLPGAKSEFFQGFSLFVGALFTLGSTAAVGNMVSGIILTYTRAFRTGDRVRIGEAIGDVLVKSLFVTRLRTIKNEEITIPNSVVLGGQVVNYTNAATRGELALTMEVGIGYDVHWRKVERLLKTAANQTPDICDNPEPLVWPTNLGDFAVVYELLAYTNRADRMGATYAALRRNALDALHDADVEIMTPNVQAVRDASQVAVPVENAPDRTKHSDGIRVHLSGLGKPSAE